MKGDLLPEEHHIVRYAGFRNLDGKTVGPEAFTLRPDEKCLSVNWLEYYEHLDKEGQLAEIRKAPRLKLGSKGRYVELNVGAIYSHLAEYIEALKIFHSPLGEDSKNEADPSHSEIAGLPSDDSDKAKFVARIIARECVLALHPTVEE